MTLFGEFADKIVFLHIVSAIVWIGGMIAIRVSVHPVLQSLEDPKIRLQETLQIVGRLFHLVMPFIVILIATGVAMQEGFGLAESGLGTEVLIKEGIWAVMTLNFTYMYFKRKKAVRLFEEGNLSAAKTQISRLPNLLLPINIALGLAEVFLGVVLRGL